MWKKEIIRWNPPEPLKFVHNSQQVLFLGVRLTGCWGVPWVLEQSLQDSIPVFRSDFFLVDHLRDHLLSNAFEGLLFTVENHYAWLKVTDSSMSCME